MEGNTVTIVQVSPTHVNHAIAFWLGGQKFIGKVVNGTARVWKEENK